MSVDSVGQSSNSSGFSGTVNIPGLGKENIDSLVNRTLASEKARLTNMQNQQKALTVQQQAWNWLSSAGEKLDNAAQAFLGLNSVFQQDILKVDKPNALEAITIPNTLPPQVKSYSITINKLATPSVLGSTRDINPTQAVPAGIYQFQTKQKTIQMNVAPKTNMQQLINQINQQKDLSGQNLLNATMEGSKLHLQSVTDPASPIQFAKQALPWAQSLGLVQSKDQVLTLPVQTNTYSTIQPMETIRIPLSDTLSKALSQHPGTWKITISYTKDAPSQESLAPQKFQFHNVGVSNASWFPQKNQIAGNWVLSSNNKIIGQPDLSTNSPSSSTMASLSKTPSSAHNMTKTWTIQNQDIKNNSIDLTNLSIDKSHIQSIELSTTHSVHLKDVGNIVKKGTPSELSINGQSYTNPSNKINNLIPGVQLNLLEKQKNIHLQIEKNTKGIESKIMDFFQNYNEMMDKLAVVQDNYTVDNSDPTHSKKIFLNKNTLSQAQLSDSDKKIAKTVHGALSAQFTLNNLQTQLLQTISRPYGIGPTIRMIQNLGFDTQSISDIVKTNPGIIRLNDPNKLADALEKYPKQVQSFFASTAKGSILVTGGLAYSMDKVLGNYINSSGKPSIFSSSLTGLKELMKGQSNNIQNYKEQLKKDEASQRAKFNGIQASVSSMQGLQSALKNLPQTGK